MSGINEMFFRFHEKLSHGFRGYGAFVVRHTLAVFLCGVAFFFAISFGIFAAHKETQLDKLWVETDSRIQTEKAFYEEKFGGLTRQEPVALVEVEGDQVITKDNLNAWRALLIPMLTEQESNPYNAALSSVSSPLQTNVKVYQTDLMGTKVASLTHKTFCERPPVPSLYFSAAFAAASGAPYNVSGACLNAACGYQRLVSCLNTATMGAWVTSSDVLGIGWGLDRFPCTRTVALDCFSEGTFDYPLALRQLDRVAWKVLIASNANPMSSDPSEAGLAAAYTGCLSAAQGTFMAPYLTSAQITSLQSVLKLSVQAFASFGYWWRQSYTAKDNAGITAYMLQAVDNGRNPLVTSTDCIAQSAFFKTTNMGKECCVNWAGTKVGEQLYGGGITISTGKFLATRMVANNYHQDHPTFLEQLTVALKAAGITDPTFIAAIDRTDLVERFEAVWQDYLLPFWRRDVGTGFADGEGNDNLRLYFAMWRATDDTIREGSTAETPLLVGAHLLLIGYMCLAFAKLAWPCSGANAVYSRMGLAVWAIICEIASVVASFGVMGIISVKLSPIALTLVPFLSLGIGVDDMLVVGHTLIIHNKSHSLLDRIKECLGACGPAVLQTTLANITSFFIASITPIRVVESFAIHMGFSILLNFIALFVLFVPVMAWDVQRSMQKRTDFYVAPCVALDSNIPAENDPSIAEGGNVITNITKTYITPVLSMWWVKVLILVVIYAYSAAMAWNGATNTKKGLNLSDIALRGTFVREYTDIQETYFGSYASYLVTTDKANFRDTNFQSRLLYTLHKLDTSKWRSTAMRMVDLSWFATSSSRLLAFGNTIGMGAGVATPIEPLIFDVAFTGWISSLGITSAPDIVCETVPGGVRTPCTSVTPGNFNIVASRHTMYNHNLFSAEDIIESMADNRYIADFGLAPGEGFMFGFLYQYYQQYVNVDANLNRVVGWSLLGVFGAALLFTFSPIAAGIMCLVILQIVVQLWGMCSIIGVKLNAFSVVNLSFSVGIAVEFTSYVVHVFLVAKGTRNQRMCYAVEEMMAPMFNGALATFLAVLVLVGAKFPFFRIYYFAMFSMMVALALINGMFCLPVLLSLIGPPSMKGEGDDNSKDIGMQRLETHDTQSTTNLAAV